LRKRQKLTLGHSPDADDAFMFYALARGRVRAHPLVFEHVIADIESLNRWAVEGKLDLTALSAHAYARASRHYLLLPAGGSFDEGYGPVVVARERRELSSLSGATVAVPGRMTTAALLLSLAVPGARPLEVPFEEVLDTVLSGRAEAGVLIHEGQLTYASLGLHLVADLGQWWKEETGHPLPLGLCAIRRELDPGVMHLAAAALKESVRWALENEEEALEGAMAFARGLDREQVRRFCLMYVNRYTLDMGEEGREALRTLYRWAAERGLIPSCDPEFFPPHRS
jgi:1,4-dihydroxy-6-naphthoate synthase